MSSGEVAFKETKFLEDADSFRTPFKKRKGTSDESEA